MAPFIRIGLRYLAAFLVTRGVLAPGDGDMISSDPDVFSIVETVAGALIMAGTEGYYLLARRMGWSK